MRLCDAHGEEFARALINYAAPEVDKVKVGGCSQLVCLGPAGSMDTVAIARW